MKKNILRILIVFLILASFTGFVLLTQKNSGPITKEGYYFDTYITITVYNQKDSKYINDCFKLCEKYDVLFDRTDENGDVYRINQERNHVSIDPETYDLLSKAIDYSKESNGKVDITVAPLIDTWGFVGSSIQEKKDKPSDEEIKEAVNKINYENIILEDDGTVSLKDEAEIDLGFIAKGYIADKLKEYLVSKDVKSAVISLGGNVVVIGNKPDGSEYTVGIKDPDNKNDICQTVKVSDESVVTSGTYERYVEYDGIKYHHILDTKTGYPVDNNIKSVTVICDSSTDADALSTLCLILGEEESKEILKNHNAEATFITAD